MWEFADRLLTPRCHAFVTSAASRPSSAPTVAITPLVSTSKSCSTRSTKTGSTGSAGWTSRSSPRPTTTRAGAAASFGLSVLGELRKEDHGYMLRVKRLASRSSCTSLIPDADAAVQGGLTMQFGRRICLREMAHRASCPYHEIVVVIRMLDSSLHRRRAWRKWSHPDGVAPTARPAHGLYRQEEQGEALGPPRRCAPKLQPGQRLNGTVLTETLRESRAPNS